LLGLNKLQPNVAAYVFIFNVLEWFKKQKIFFSAQRYVALKIEKIKFIFIAIKTFFYLLKFHFIIYLEAIKRKV
jgi:hypothetical protein